jgi:pilus assembly protein CpaB
VKRRIIAAAVAILVAVVSGILLISYVTSADQRAMAGMRTEQVLVATAPVPQGTRADELGELVALRSLPAKAVVPGALTSVTALRNKITTTELQPGEQLLASRFADPSALQDSLAVQVPKGFSEVSIQLDPQRAVGNNLSPGDRVGVYISLGTASTRARPTSSCTRCSSPGSRASPPIRLPRRPRASRPTGSKMIRAAAANLHRRPA